MPASPTARDSRPALPRDVDGFRLQRELGRGGMGIVYLAEELSSGRTVALKVLAAGSEVSEEAFERFRRESRMAASISDSRCVFVYGAHQVEGSPAIAMELCPGETLEHRMAKSKGDPIAIETAVRWTIEILEGLEAAHRAGVVHRDVKPSNCFITHDDHVKVGDFGLSRSLDTDIRLTQSGAFLGSPLYASPEQIRGRDVDMRGDIYSCGATLYALLSGRAPFRGQNIGEVLARILSESPPSLRSVRPDVPPELERVIARAMEREPERRFRDHASFRAALEPFVAGEAAPAGWMTRLVSFLLDEMLASVMVTGLVFLSTSQGWSALEMDPTRPGRFRSLGVSLLLALLPVLYFALFEGLGGATPARWMFGQRVVDARTRRPNLLRCILRACVFFGPGFVSLVCLYPLALSQNAFALWSQVVSLGIYAVLASSMRRRNGLRGLHEFASGTRVVQARSPFARSEESRPVPVHAAAAVEGWPTELGPYRIEGTLDPTPTGTLLLGVDQNLSRGVWIYARKAGDTAAGESRRSLARPGRLRWLDAMHRGDTLFEVFEAPGGASLSACVVRGARFDWPSAQRVLAALADELSQIAAAPAGGSPLAVCVEQVWIDRTWAPRLLDEPVGPGPFTFRSPLELLSDAARLVLGIDASSDAGLPTELPASAELALRKLLGREAPFADIEEARRELKALSSRPMRLTSAARAVQMVVSAIAPALLLFIVILVMFALGKPIDRFVESARCIQQLRAQDATPPPAKLMDAEDRRAREVLIADAGTDPWSAAFVQRLEAADREIQARAVAAHPAPSADEVAWARERTRARPFVKGETDSANPTDAKSEEADAVNAELAVPGRVSVSSRGGERFAEARWKVIPLVVACTIAAWGVLSTLFALLLRGGLSLKLLGMGVRDQRGERASRLRCAWRSLIVWVPLSLLYGIGAWLANHGHVALGAAIILGAASMHALALAYAISRPSRGVQDRLAGTHLVTR